MKKSEKGNMLSADEFDTAFEEGDVTEFLDLKSAKARYPTQQINIVFPKNILEKVDTEAARIGVTRTSLIKMWVAQQVATEHRDSSGTRRS